MKKNALLLIALTFTILLFSFETLPGEVQAKPDRAETRGTVLYVTSGGGGACTSWADACGLQTALLSAVATDEIWVQAGTYKPTDTTDRNISFVLKNGVAIYGGFAGTETSREQRDWVSNLTILSGDIGITEDTIDNSLHVVYGSELDATSILDGFIISYGNADSLEFPNYNGGGMLNESNSNPTLSNLIFSDNYALASGGGVFNFFYSNPTLSNVTFNLNTAGNSGGGMSNYHHCNPDLTHVTFSFNSADYGGGMNNDNVSSPSLTNVTFFDNSASSDGGGMFNASFSNPSLTHATFSENIASFHGGGIHNEGNASPTLANVTFVSNEAQYGGGIYNFNYSSPTLTNVTLSNNRGGIAGGALHNDTFSSPILTNVTMFFNRAHLYGAGMYNEFSSDPIITNTIMFDMGADIENYLSTPSIFYSIYYIVSDGTYIGEGNINTLDPLLGPLADNGGFTQTHALLPGSAAIDTGSPTTCPATDQRGFSRPTDGDGDELPECDMGAYESHQIIFVDEDALGLDNGTSWADAFMDLQDALAIANEGDEIWVAEGAYLPTTTTDRTISFQLKNGVAIYGGFAGTETAREQRDCSANPTLLSGDIGVSDDYSDNSYHVVYGTLLDATTILDGFTISFGFADETSAVQYGGGVYNHDHSSPTITNINFINNHAAVKGGGMYNYNHSNPTMNGDTFYANAAGFGAGITNSLFSNPIITNATFSENTAYHSGGGMLNELSSPTITNVTFYYNSAMLYGGGLFNSSSSPILTNVILWNNSVDQIYNELDSTPVITYSDIQGGYPGIGNISTNPLLGPLADNGGFTQTHALLPGSAAIDTGSPTVCPATDQRGVTRPIDGDWDLVPRCDMGAYEYEPVIFYNYLPLVIR